MKLLRSAYLITATVIAILALCSFASAQTRTFISSTGSDANPCSRPSPCRNYQAAINAVLNGGEVVPLDSAGYGTISIVNKSVSIIVPSGIYAGVAVTSGTAINISLSSSTQHVYLSGIQVNGNDGASATGIAVSGSGKVNISNCLVSRFSGTGSKGIFVTGGEVNIESSQIIENRVAVRAEGQGPDQDSSTNGTIARVTIVRISGGFISDNATAFEMHNVAINGTGIKGSGCNAQNIFLRTFGGGNDPLTNIVGNTTFLTMSGTSENGFCGAGNDQIGKYSSQQANGTTVASQ